MKTEFQKEMLSALRSNKDHTFLLDQVHRFGSQGLSARDMYDVLEKIWLELGFDEQDEETALQQELEFVMEKVWYEGGLTNSSVT